MKRPTAANVLGKSYSLRFFDQLPDSSAGRMNPRQQVIQIATRRRHPDYIRDTLLHELIHAISYQIHLNLAERQVHALSAALLQVLWDNPAVARYLLTK